MRFLRSSFETTFAMSLISKVRLWITPIVAGIVQHTSQGWRKNYEIDRKLIFHFLHWQCPTWMAEISYSAMQETWKFELKNSISENPIVFLPPLDKSITIPCTQIYDICSHLGDKRHERLNFGSRIWFELRKCSRMCRLVHVGMFYLTLCKHKTG